MSNITWPIKPVGLNVSRKRPHASRLLPRALRISFSDENPSSVRKDNWN